jgi:patatin-related protein
VIHDGPPDGRLEQPETPGATLRESTATPAMDITQETRFAIVMYGGVSLAIYINGVAQELLRLVRATAASPSTPGVPMLNTDSLRGTEKIYRRLGQMLGREGAEERSPVDASSPIRTRFVVDILSGTSAGGINAVFLAKAIANNQDISELRRLWLEEGDIEKLINDGRGQSPLKRLRQPKPKSLLDSQRMLDVLRFALDGMDKASPPTPAASLADELDLFITTTDLQGLPVSLRLADGVVQERRHRNVFQLRYDRRPGTARNDFRPQNNAFLAFVSRCTSAFPFAFEPMSLGQLGGPKAVEEWADFFPTYREPETKMVPAALRERPFADGGYLDNKPFSYALDALAFRRSNVPVDRKLIYIEPSPEDLLANSPRDETPNAIENVAAALFLARYETIREDLQRILARNRVMERVGVFLENTERDLGQYPEAQPITGEDFATRDLDEMILQEGVGYGGYHRLKVANLTDDIARLVSRTLEFDEDSDEFLAIRYLVREWRQSRFAANPRRSALPGQETENAFLVKYDLGYRLRRLSFVLDKIDQLLTLGPKAKEMVEIHAKIELPPTGEERAQFRRELMRMRDALTAVFRTLRRAYDSLATAGAGNPLALAVAATGLTRRDLAEILAPKRDAERVAKATEVLSSRADAFDDLAEALANEVETRTNAAAADADRILEPEPGAAQYAAIATSIVSHYYLFFDRYDLLAYPLLYTAGVSGEYTQVDVLRISPRDAPRLVDESSQPRRKLAGTAFMNFGAFLDAGWRRNDFLWGRLDGAERLISALLPEKRDEVVRERLIKRAQVAILKEEVVSADASTLSQLLADAMAGTEEGDQSEKALRNLVARNFGTPINAPLHAALRRSLAPSALHAFFASGYEVGRRLNPRRLLSVIARCTHVIGGMLETVAASYRLSGKPGLWLSRAGRVFWGLVEVAVPRSLGTLFWHHWLGVLYILELLVVFGGLALSFKGIYQFGLIALSITLALHFVTLLIGDYVIGQRRWLRILGMCLILAVLGLAVVGADRIFDLLSRIRALLS